MREKNAKTAKDKLEFQLLLGLSMSWAGLVLDLI